MQLFTCFTHSPCDAAIGKWTVKSGRLQADRGGGSIQVVNRGSWYQIEIEISLYFLSRISTDLGLIWIGYFINISISGFVWKYE